MSVRVDDNAIVLEGRCSAEDAEALLLALQDHPRSVVDVRGMKKCHLAVAQILLALRPTLQGLPDTPFPPRNIFRFPSLE